MNLPSLPPEELNCDNLAALILIDSSQSELGFTDLQLLAKNVTLTHVLPMVEYGWVHKAAVVHDYRSTTTKRKPRHRFTLTDKGRGLLRHLVTELRTYATTLLG